MGKFANTSQEDRGQAGVGAYVGPRPKELHGHLGMYHGKSEWEALGLPVPFFRRSNAIKHMKDMGFKDREQMEAVVGKMSECIERDDSHMALENALEMGVDATGCYRLLAVLLTGDPPKKEEPEANYVDLVK